MILSRRQVLGLSGMGLILSSVTARATQEFWDQKDPKDWTQEEIDRLLTRSPWARQVTAAPTSGLPRPAVDGGGFGIGMGRRRGNPVAHPASGKATVRWESAQPLRDVAKTSLASAFQDHYVIGVYGLDVRGDLDDLKQFATLQPKGRELAQAGVVQTQPGTPSGVLFGFSRDLLDLSRDDKEVNFSSQFGQLVVRAKFVPQEMICRGRLVL
jgi:hypothetical protein